MQGGELPTIQHMERDNYGQTGLPTDDVMPLLPATDNGAEFHTNGANAFMITMMISSTMGPINHAIDGVRSCHCF